MLPLSTDADTASLWWAYVDRYVTRRSGAEAALAEVIEADPGLAVARAAALLMIGLDSADFDPAEQTAAARRGRADHDWERSFTEATLTTHSQGMWPARPAWERHQQRFPADLIGLSVTVFLTLSSTEPDAEDRALAIARASADAVGEHPVLVGFEAMTAQDQGRLDDAHRLALRALELDPTGFSGGHPLAHVFFESGDHAGGIAWLDDWLPTTDQDGVVRLPPRLALRAPPPRGRRRPGRPRALPPLRRPAGRGRAWSTAPRCCGDASSTAWCRTAPTPPTPRSVRSSHTWSTPCPPRSSASTSPSASPPRVMPRDCAGCGGRARSFTAPGAAELLPGLARGLAAYVEGDHAAASDLLLAEEPHVVRYGGSHAQREVFEDTLLQTLAMAERYDEATTRLQARLDRRESRLDATCSRASPRLANVVV